MSPTSSDFGNHAALELRVLAGAQTGARAPLPAACTIAAGAGNDGADIVLRASGADAACVRVTSGGTQALLEVTHGCVTLHGQPLHAGSGAVWPMHAPLHIAGSVVAFGRADEEAWPEPAPPHEAVPHAGADGVPRWLLPLGIALAVGCAGLLGLVQVVSAEHPAAAAQAPSLADALQGSEFASLSSTRDAQGRTVLRGRLATLAQRTRLQAWLAQRELSPQVDVLVDEALERDVTDVFRVNGVAVQARVQGAGDVVADTSDPDAAHVARAEEVVHRDVPGLRQLSVVNHATPAPPPRPPLPDEPGKRIASVVPGDPSYLVTADGSRYFIGALLPSGDRITAIDRQRVTLERQGQVTTLNL